ncbi:MAG: hypothetical protein H6747_10045 [Deltaproteobacteria bacterium]|nr:hypothetical protein [Deltaproteobacteria bacterium]
MGIFDDDDDADWLAEGIDFLDPGAGRAALADRLEAVRRSLTGWAGQTLATRRPELPPHRGIKGIRILEADFDATTRQLVLALRHDDAEGLRRHAQWYRQVVRARPNGEAAIDAGSTVLIEALLRFLGGRDGAVAARLLTEALGVTPPAALAQLLAD